MWAGWRLPQAGSLNSRDVPVFGSVRFCQACCVSCWFQLCLVFLLRAAWCGELWAKQNRNRNRNKLAHATPPLALTEPRFLHAAPTRSRLDVVPIRQDCHLRAHERVNMKENRAHVSPPRSKGKGEVKLHTARPHGKCACACPETS